MMRLTARLAVTYALLALAPVTRAEAPAPDPALDTVLRELADGLRSCDADTLSRHVRFPLRFTEADTTVWTGTHNTYRPVPAIEFKDARELAEACRAGAERIPRSDDLDGATSTDLSRDGSEATRHTSGRLLTFAQRGGRWQLTQVWSVGVSRTSSHRDDPAGPVEPGWPPDAPQDLDVPAKHLAQLPVTVEALMRAFDDCDPRAFAAHVRFPFTVEQSYGEADPATPAPNPPTPRATYKNAAALARACLLRVPLRPTVHELPGNVFTTARLDGKHLFLEVPAARFGTDFWQLQHTPQGWRLVKVFHPDP